MSDAVRAFACVRAVDDAAAAVSLTERACVTTAVVVLEAGALSLMFLADRRALPVELSALAASVNARDCSCTRVVADVAGALSLMVREV